MIRNKDNSMQLRYNQTDSYGLHYYTVWTRELGTRIINSGHTDNELSAFGIDTDKLNELLKLIKY